jgi:hypothetical protein
MTPPSTSDLLTITDAQAEAVPQPPWLETAAEAEVEAEADAAVKTENPPADEAGPQAAAAHKQLGPLVAVCGLCGGAGASTLTYLVAQSVGLDAEQGSGAVLALDAGGMTGGLSLYSGEASPRSLSEIAEDIRGGRTVPGPMFATAAGGMRLIATAPHLQPDPDPALVSRILADARAAHRMTVVDCGVLSLPGERLALEVATHVVWIVPATEHGLSRARLSPWVVSDGEVVQVVVARHDPSGRKASTRALARLADDRQATLVLMPHVTDLDRRSFGDALEVCGVTLQALQTKLRQ